jgi:hypothetical protein
VWWYQKSVDGGFAEAECDLGVRYLHGQGVNKDERAGLALVRKAAEQGYLEALDILKARGLTIGDTESGLPTYGYSSPTSSPAAAQVPPQSEDNRNDESALSPQDEIDEERREEQWRNDYNTADFIKLSPRLTRKYGELWKTALGRYESLDRAIGRNFKSYTGILRVTPSLNGTSEIVLQGTEGAGNFDTEFLTNGGPTPEDRLPEGEKTFSMVWTENRPVPFCDGCQVRFGVDSRNQIQAIVARADEYLAVRKGTDGLVEVVLGVGTFNWATGQRDMSKPKLYVVPDYLDLTVTFIINVTWSKKMGIAIVDGPNIAGDSADEVEALRLRQAGWPMANMPGMRVLPGRDGWMLYKNVPQGDGVQYETFIPPQQHIMHIFNEDKLKRVEDEWNRQNPNGIGP